MAEAVFACKKVEELPDDHMARLLAAACTEFARLAEDLFMCDGPANARDRQRDKQQLDDLDAELASGHIN